jgi:DegV family protein with EDD domain
MNYKIVGDSCMDLPDYMKDDPHFVKVPLTIQLGSKQFDDDEFFDQKDFLTCFENSQQFPQTASPSPMKYIDTFEGGEECIFVITLSGALSGSYNSALVAKSLYEEEHGLQNKKIAIINSESASSGEFRIALLIQQLCEQNLGFEEIVNRATRFRDKMKTFFVLENLDVLKRSGRLSGLKEKLISVLNIKLVMGTDKGHIRKIIQERGIRRTLQKMCETASAEVENIKDKILIISHINNPERAEFVKNEMQKYCGCKDVVIMNGGGISTVYAGKGGIILAI